MPLELVFIHGWGFDARFWDVLCALLPQFRQQRVDLGFFGAPPATENTDSSKRVLIGHSLGFVHGLAQRPDWDGWIAINSFTRFVSAPSKIGCVKEAVLRDMRMRLRADPSETLNDFYRMIGASALADVPSIEDMLAGLEELRDCDIEKRLAALDVPGLVLAGRNDPLVRVDVSEGLRHAAKQGTLVLHDNGGHLLPQTQPAWCAQEISDFILAHFGNEQ